MTSSVEMALGNHKPGRGKPCLFDRSKKKGVPTLFFGCSFDVEEGEDYSPHSSTGSEWEGFDPWRCYIPVDQLSESDHLDWSPDESDVSNDDQWDGWSLDESNTPNDSRLDWNLDEYLIPNSTQEFGPDNVSHKELSEVGEEVVLKGNRGIVQKVLPISRSFGPRGNNQKCTSTSRGNGKTIRR